MIPAPTIALWINIAKVSGGLSGIDNRKAAIYRGGTSPVDVRRTFLLNFFGGTLEWMAAQSAFVDTTPEATVALYTYALCSSYAIDASQIITDETGQSIVPSGNTPTPVLFGSSVAEVCGIGDGPTAGLNTYRPFIGGIYVLTNGTNVKQIFVNNLEETSLAPDAQFTFDPTTGTITRIGNVWQTGDKVIIPYQKYV